MKLALVVSYDGVVLGSMWTKNRRIRKKTTVDVSIKDPNRDDFWEVLEKFVKAKFGSTACLLRVDEYIEFEEIPNPELITNGNEEN